MLFFGGQIRTRFFLKGQIQLGPGSVFSPSSDLNSGKSHPDPQPLIFRTSLYKHENVLNCIKIRRCYQPPLTMTIMEGSVADPDPLESFGS